MEGTGNMREAHAEGGCGLVWWGVCRNSKPICDAKIISLLGHTAKPTELFSVDALKGDVRLRFLIM